MRHVSWRYEEIRMAQGFFALSQFARRRAPRARDEKNFRRGVSADTRDAAIPRVENFFHTSVAKACAGGEF
jgi:hypothetical protein